LGFAAELETKFKEMFSEDYGIRVYVVPIILLVATASIVLFFGFTGGISLAVKRSSANAVLAQPLGITMDMVSVAAIFGAYTWIASDVIVRNHQWTLHPSDLAWYALRMIVAVPLGWALALAAGGANIATAAVSPGLGAFVAFVASMFSLDAITNALATVATRAGMPMNASPEERDDLIIKLPGVDEVKAKALNVEGVSTIAQLVAVDPIRTSIRAGLPFEYILNLVDAAILWMFVGKNLNLLAPFDIRGASDILALDEAWNGASAAAFAALRQADAAAKRAGDAKSAAEAALAAAEAQPNAQPATLNKQ
jgi:hypothetical protein